MEQPWKVIFAFLGVFVAGAVFGGFFSLRVAHGAWVVDSTAPVKLTAASAQPSTSHTTPAQPPIAPSGAAAKVNPPAQPAPQDVQRAQLMRRVASQLGLTPAQKGLVDPMIRRAVQDIWRQQQNFFRETAFITERMKQEIARELTPEQQNRLEELWQNALQEFRKRQADAQAQRRAAAAAQSPNPPTGTAAVTPPAKTPGNEGAAKPPSSGGKDQPVPAAKPPGDGK